MGKETYEGDQRVKGDLDLFFQRIKEFPRNRDLTQREKDELWRRKEEGDAEAREELIKININLAVSMTNRHKSLAKDVALMDETDLIQEAIVGLIKGIDGMSYERYRDDKGSNYLVSSVKNEIFYGINKRRLIKIPTQYTPNIFQELRKLNGGHDNGREQLSESELETKLKEIMGSMSPNQRKHHTVASLKRLYNFLKKKTVREFKDRDLPGFFVYKDPQQGIYQKAEIRKKIATRIEETMKESQSVVERESLEILIAKLMTTDANGEKRSNTEIGHDFYISRECLEWRLKKLLPKLRSDPILKELFEELTA